MFMLCCCVVVVVVCCSFVCLFALCSVLYWNTSRTTPLQNTSILTFIDMLSNYTQLAELYFYFCSIRKGGLGSVGELDYIRDGRTHLLLAINI